MREVDFIARLQELLASPVTRLDPAAKAEIVLAAAERLRDGRAGLECRIVPFVPGWRPTDEASHPRLGSSDQAALVLGDDGAQGRENTAYMLFDVSGAEGRRVQFDVTLSFAGLDGSIDSDPIPGWDRRPVRAMAFDATDGAQPRLREVDMGALGMQRLVLALSPEHDLLPVDDPYTFGHLFARLVCVELRVTEDGVPLAATNGRLLAGDVRRLGSLYRRLTEQLVAPDTERQAAAAGVSNPGAAFHPWYPVLEIGRDKAALYTRALIGDIVHKRRNLTDPVWLLRVGLYLEFLTCLGVVEAAKDDVGDLLTPAERRAFEHSALFGEIRGRINTEGWRTVWRLREIAFPGRGAPRAGPVSARNLIGKRNATLAFLEVHHEDLKHAIELAGPNHHNAQETWQRVFRDAERAVLRGTPNAFPELGFLPPRVREFVLWHRRGDLGSAIALHVPGPIMTLLGDQDGLFASACSQYRRSMNAVAAWSKERMLMDYTGSECVPSEASLLESKIARPANVALLQRRDGYSEPLDVAVELPDSYERSTEEVRRLLAEAPIFAMLTGEELQELARTARPVTLGPLERLIVQGQHGTSLFVIVEGAVEVMLRREDGQDWAVDTMARGAVVGEMSLLTGEPRAATIRAITGATAYEIGRHQYEPLLRARPQLVDELAAMLEVRLRSRGERLRAYDAERERNALRDRIRRFVIRDR